MSILFGSARSNEYGGISGGQKGDQTGGEVSTQAFYMHSKGWLGFRFISAVFAAAMATAMKEACDNDNIGYCQDHRGTLLTEFLKTMSIKAITTPCECDCSSLIRVCIYQATGVLLDDFNTASEPEVLRASKMFEEFTVASSASVYNGDILCTPVKGHTGAIVSGRPRSSDSEGSGSSGDLEIDGEAGPLTIEKWQTVMGQTGKNVDGFIDGQDQNQSKYWKGLLSSVCRWSGGSSPFVRKWQTFLNNEGYSCGKVDGELGYYTAVATQRYLIAKGYSCGTSGADGWFEEKSVMALQKWLNAQ